MIDNTTDLTLPPLRGRVPCGCRAGEGSATLIQGAPFIQVATSPEAWFPSPGSLRSPPSPAVGGGFASGMSLVHLPESELRVIPTVVENDLWFRS
ncbi:hypothetical protein EOE48_18230 [Methylobacterium oryzihabitans]|uniref:Uncharacterized protein n=1 Tax=Methylobacterium oryzihabitans TaxID=2499852 RepID=A0A437P120_9HYPH|nr:hypothetical protein EOE48_18230 [Methylobacterium oryzihabitans]